MRHMLGRQFKGINNGKSTGGSVHQITVVPKIGKISCEKMTINYIISFPTVVFPGHKICKLRNNNHRLRSGAARRECDNTLERTLHFTGEEARS